MFALPTRIEDTILVNLNLNYKRLIYVKFSNTNLSYNIIKKKATQKIAFFKEKNVFLYYFTIGINNHNR